MPNNPFGSFEDAFEQGISQVKAGVGQQVKATVQNTQTQLTGQTPASSDKQGKPDTLSGTDQFNETGNTQQQNQQQDPQQPAQQQLEAAQQEEKQKKLAETREQLMRLHKQTYFDPTFNSRPKKEPTVQERLEQEKQQEEQKKMEELKEEKKKEEPVALSRAKRNIEMNRGASG